MWVCLNNAFLSIVTPGRYDGATSSHLLVRARREGDIQRVFPGADVQVLPHRDYLYRALVERAEVGRALADQVAGIDYNNFKNSVRNRPLHDAYASVWGVMARLQPSPPYSGYAYGEDGLFDERPSAPGRCNRGAK